MTETAAPKGKRPKQGRSPAYPGLPLSQAIAQAQALYDAEGKYAVPMPSAFTAWGYGAKSSGGRETRAALKYYGLAVIEGDGEKGKVKLTDDAFKVLLDQREDQSEKQALIRILALTPAIHKKLFQKFPDGIKSDATVEHYLTFEEGYNPAAAAELVAQFKATADYAGLFKPANVLVKDDIDQANNERPEVGDLVNVEVGGALVFPAPKRVRAVDERDSTRWVFVEGEIAGIPMEQVQVIKKAGDVGESPGNPPTMPLDPPAPGWREERLLDDAGQEIFIRYKGEASKERYEFIRDYLDFKLKRIKP
ncbi:MAG TPA: hypothetical protein VNO69_11355 [Methyloceanibacter sp.]|nr:hypothetical protein [Methyloceanibacter sp.]